MAPYRLSSISYKAHHILLGKVSTALFPGCAAARNGRYIPALTPGAERGWDGMFFYEFIETTQAILVSLILTDGSAQAVSNALDTLKVVIRNLK